MFLGYFVFLSFEDKWSMRRKDGWMSQSSTEINPS